jgi:hypothetical protein
MKQVEINLGGPFGEVLATVLALESTDRKAKEIRSQGAPDSGLHQNGHYDAEVIEAVRSLYEAANGRQVESQIGFIAIAPPVAGFLKDKPYYVATQCEFFVEAFARILIAASPLRENGPNGARRRGGKPLGNRRGTRVRQNHGRKANGNLLPKSTTTRSQQPTLIRHD